MDDSFINKYKDILFTEELFNLRDYELTYIAEELGDFDQKDVFEILKRLVKHKRAYVREGALYGIEKFSPSNEVAELLRDVIENDDDLFIVEIAGEIYSYLFLENSNV